MLETINEAGAVNTLHISGLHNPTRAKEEVIRVRLAMKVSKYLSIYTSVLTF